MPRISAGRVQSVATRLIVEKERERMAFISSAWWDLAAVTALGFNARLLEVDGKKVAATIDFGADGAVKEKSLANILLLDEAGARGLVDSLKSSDLTVKSMEESPRTERPKPPFTTSTMQQDAGSRLGWGAQITMRVAQRLYENGYITYMRTDSINLSQQAITAARSAAKALYGADHVDRQARAQDHAGQASGQKPPDGELANFGGIFVANRRHGHRHDAASGDAAQQAEAQQDLEGGGEDAANRAKAQQPEAGLQHPRLAVEVADGPKYGLAQRIGEGIDRGQKRGCGDWNGKVPRNHGQQRVHRSIGERACEAAQNEDEEHHEPV
jgi:hypothetical protein